MILKFNRVLEVAEVRYVHAEFHQAMYSGLWVGQSVFRYLLATTPPLQTTDDRQTDTIFVS